MFAERPHASGPSLRVASLHAEPSFAEPPIPWAPWVVAAVGLPRWVFLLVAMTTDAIAGAFDHALTSSLGFFLFPTVTVARAITAGSGAILVAACVAAVVDAALLAGLVVWLSKERAGAERD